MTREIEQLKFAPEVADLPMHSKGEQIDLMESMKTNGFLDTFPIVRFGDEIFDGRNRYNTAVSLGIEPAYKYALSRVEALKLAESSYLQRTFTADQKLQVKIHFTNLRQGISVSDLKRSNPNVSVTTIEQVAKQTESSISKAKKSNANKNAVIDGRVPIEVNNRVIRGDDTVNSTYEAIKFAEKLAKSTFGDDNGKAKKMVSELTEEAAEYANEHDVLLSKAIRKVTDTKITTDSGHTIGSNDCEWYTPIEITDSARLVMGSIDCDPASNDYAQGRIKAGTYFTKDNSGLYDDVNELPRLWLGNVWMNPPYGKSEKGEDGCAKFIDHLIEQVNVENVTQYLVLVNTSNGTSWYTNMMNHCTMFGLSIERIQFDRHENSLVDKKDANTKGQTLFYFGENDGAFIEQYSDLFSIAIPVNPSTSILYDD